MTDQAYISPDRLRRGIAIHLIRHLGDDRARQLAPTGEWVDLEASMTGDLTAWLRPLILADIARIKDVIAYGGNNADPNCEGAHIDEQCVLLDLGAKRKILDLYDAARSEYLAALDRKSRSTAIDLQESPEEQDVAAAYFIETMLTTIVRLLALPYSSEPGYDETWRPA